MPNKSSETPFDFMQMLLPKWPAPYFSNWVFAEREDKLEELTFSSLQKFNKAAWDRAEKVIDDQMSFVSHRMHQDFECAKSLSECRMPDEAFATLQSFYTQMADEYQRHARGQMGLFQDGMNEGMATAEELGETALETAAELSKAAEENLQNVKPMPARRRRKVA